MATIEWIGGRPIARVNLKEGQTEQLGNLSEQGRLPDNGVFSWAEKGTSLQQDLRDNIENLLVTVKPFSDFIDVGNGVSIKVSQDAEQNIQVDIKQGAAESRITTSVDGKSEVSGQLPAGVTESNVASWMEGLNEQLLSDRNFQADRLAEARRFASPNTPQAVQAAFDASVVGVGEGSGAVVGTKGDKLVVATNAHVVKADGKVEVTLPDGSKVMGEVIYNGEANFTRGEGLPDLALVVIPKNSQVSPVKLGAMPTVGDQIFSAGFPLEDLVVRPGNPPFVISGSITNVMNDQNDVEGEANIAALGDMRLLSGMSGGLAVNEKGELIGINQGGGYMGINVPVGGGGSFKEAMNGGNQRYVGVNELLDVLNGNGVSYQQAH